MDSSLEAYPSDRYHHILAPAVDSSTCSTVPVQKWPQNEINYLMPSFLFQKLVKYNFIKSILNRYVINNFDYLNCFIIFIIAVYICGRLNSNKLAHRATNPFLTKSLLVGPGETPPHSTWKSLASNRGWIIRLFATEPFYSHLCSIQLHFAADRKQLMTSNPTWLWDSPSGIYWLRAGLQFESNQDIWVSTYLMPTGPIYTQVIQFYLLSL